ncbi:hypothetical protein ACFY7H_23865 [Streptomyces sp. NPDC012794]|uniref:hypothetical protein n=1 Tax=Streptomyces sp. NPDC012794 TaxID=3364850 RepID=UPI00368E7DD2
MALLDVRRARSAGQAGFMQGGCDRQIGPGRTSAEFGEGLARGVAHQPREIAEHGGLLRSESGIGGQAIGDPADAQVGQGALCGVAVDAEGFGDTGRGDGGVGVEKRRDKREQLIARDLVTGGCVGFKRERLLVGFGITRCSESA